jgi:hypothetical protein
MMLVKDKNKRNPWKQAILATLFSGAAFCAHADTLVQSQTVFAGRNIYGPSLLVDGVYKMWYSAWQDDSVKDHDTIYYRESVDNVNWGPYLISYSIKDIEAALDKAGVQPSYNGRFTHITDPSVTKHINSVTGKAQYTMFFTACISAVSTERCNDQTGNEIWSAVSDDGRNWLHPQQLIGGVPEVHASEPSAIIDPQPDGTFWKVYYDDRADSTKVMLVGVDGNRKVVRQYGPVISANKTLANPEVRYFNGKWHLFANVYNGKPLTTADVYKATSTDNTQFPLSSVQPVIVNSGAPFCGTVAAGVLPVGGNQYDLYFGLIPNAAAGTACDMAGNKYIARYRFAEADAAPTCSTVNLTPSSLTAAGGSATAQAVCTGTGLSYAWTMNGAVISGSGATNSVAVSANTGTASRTFSVCVTASNASGKSPQLCAPLVQAPAAATAPPVCSPVSLTPNSLPAAGGRVSAQANCSGSGLSYKWSINSTALAGNLATNSISVNPNTTTSAMFYAVCVVASNAAGQSSNCGQLVVAATANIAPNCSSVSLTPSSLPASGGNALGQANCTHSGEGLYYTWTLNGMPYPAAGPASITYVPTNPLPIAVNPTASPRTYKLCVVANDSKGQSQLACSTPLTQAGAAVVLPSAPTVGVPMVVGSGSVSVPFTPGDLGTGSLVTYTASCGGHFATGMGSPIVVSGLVSGEPYFCQVKTTSSAGSSPWSYWSTDPVYP